MVYTSLIFLSNALGRVLYMADDKLSLGVEATLVILLSACLAGSFLIMYDKERRLRILEKKVKDLEGKKK